MTFIQLPVHKSAFHVTTTEHLTNVYLRKDRFGSQFQDTIYHREDRGQLLALQQKQEVACSHLSRSGSRKFMLEPDSGCNPEAYAPSVTNFLQLDPPSSRHHSFSKLHLSARDQVSKHMCVQGTLHI